MVPGKGVWKEGENPEKKGQKVNKRVGNLIVRGDNIF